MARITSIIPTVRVVPCAGRQVKVAELRLRDLARLQSFLDDMEPDPMTVAHESMKGKTPAEQDRIISEAYDRAEFGPPGYGDERGREFFMTPEGGSLFLWVALGRFQKVSPGEAAELFVKATATEYGRIWRIAHGVTPLESLARMMLPPSPGGQGARATWPEMICDLAEATGWTLPQIYSLTISEWVYMRNGGKDPSYERVILPGEDLAAIVGEQQRRFGGITDQ